MAISIYRSTDPSAPVLNGTAASSLITVLDAILVNGYGAKSPLGWTKEYAGTNTASYKCNTGNQMYLGVDDPATPITSLRGFHSMTAAGVATASGTSPFPADGQLGCVYLYKASAAGARPWVAISNGRLLYFFSDTALSGTGNMFAFGDITSYVANDIQSTIIIGSHSASYGTTHGNVPLISANALTVLAGHYLAGKFDQVSGSIQCSKLPILSLGMNSAGVMAKPGNYHLQYPDPIFGTMTITPFAVTELNSGQAILRGRLPGIWAPCHSWDWNTGDTLTGSPGTDLAGKSFEMFKLMATSTHPVCGCLIETSDTWDAVDFR